MPARVIKDSTSKKCPYFYTINYIFDKNFNIIHCGFCWTSRKTRTLTKLQGPSASFIIDLWSHGKLECNSRVQREVSIGSCPSFEQLLVAHVSRKKGNKKKLKVFNKKVIKNFRHQELLILLAN